MIRTLCIVAGLFVLLAAPAAQATSALYVTDVEQAKLSTAVVVATVGQSRFEMSKQYETPITLTEVSVDEVLHGTAPKAVTIEQMGGTVGKISTYIPGDARLEQGTKVVLFLRNVEGGWYLTALEQSQYVVVNGELRRTLTSGIFIRNPEGHLVEFKEPSDAPAKTIDTLKRDLATLKGAE